MMGPELFIRALFWVSFFGMLILPKKWAIILWILSAHMDLAGRGWQSGAAIGLENSIRIVLLPILLLIRIHSKQMFWHLIHFIPFQLWMIFCLYATLAVVWSPFLSSAVKMGGYLWASTIGFVIMATAWHRGFLGKRSIVIVLWGVLVLAVIQVAMGSIYGTVENRFTSFTSPQDFGMFLVCILIVLLFLPTFTASQRAIYGVIIIGALFLNGSRTNLVAAVAVLMVSNGFSFLKVLNTFKISLRSFYGTTAGIVVGVIFVCLFLILAPDYATKAQRVIVAFDLARSGNLTDVGTFAWRINIWEAVFREVGNFNWLDYLFGRGTSSTGEVFVKYLGYERDSLDANRAMHNEFLRAFYEWGLIGFCAFCLWILTTVVGGFRTFRYQKMKGLALFALTPALVANLFVENVLAGSGGAKGIGILIVLSFALCLRLRPSTAFNFPGRVTPAEQLPPSGHLPTVSRDPLFL